MFKEVLNYQESHGGASYTVKNIIDLALVKQYAGTGFYKFSYPNAFNSSQHNSTSFMNGVRESFRWMMPELLRETRQDDPDGNHIKVAVLSSTTIEGENESLVYDHMQPNRNGNGDPDWDEDNSNNRAKDEPYRFTVMQHQQAVQSWEEAEMHRNLIEKPCIWGDPSSTDNGGSTPP